MAKMNITIDGGATVEGADVTRLGVLAIHKAPDKGYILTHIPTGRIVLWCRLKGGVVKARKELEPLNWTSPEAHRGRVEELRKELLDV
jgi:hypothetical protein